MDQPPAKEPTDPRHELKKLIDSALELSDLLGETLAGCHLQMARDSIAGPLPGDGEARELARPEWRPAGRA